ncbi:hypothetical protein GCM10010341_59190 [Streptomyces noursei]|nr:hypothetical protein GCM10010341_59190 [Streptomyces noursei]
MQHPRELVVEVAAVEFVALGAAFGEQLGQVESGHEVFSLRAAGGPPKAGPAAPDVPVPPALRSSRQPRFPAMVSLAARRDSFREPMVARTAVGS